MLMFEPFSNNLWFAGCDGRLNRAALHEMDKDAKDKHHAEHIDDRMYQLRNGSIGIGYFPGIENVDNTLVSLMYNTFYFPTVEPYFSWVTNGNKSDSSRYMYNTPKIQV